MSVATAKAKISRLCSSGELTKCNMKYLASRDHCDSGTIKAIRFGPDTFEIECAASYSSIGGTSGGNTLIFTYSELPQPRVWEHQIFDGSGVWGVFLEGPDSQGQVQMVRFRHETASFGTLSAAEAEQDAKLFADALQAIISATPASRGSGMGSGVQTQAVAAEQPPFVPRDPNAPTLNVAVADFSADGLSQSDANVVANILRGDLVNTGGFNVVEKKNQDKILAEQAFQQTGCTSQECAVKLGHLLNVQRMVVGSCGRLLGKYFVNVRVINVETGKAVYADQTSGQSVDELEKGVGEISGRIAARQI